MSISMKFARLVFKGSSLPTVPISDWRKGGVCITGNGRGFTVKIRGMCPSHNQRQNSRILSLCMSWLDLDFLFARCGPPLSNTDSPLMTTLCEKNLKFAECQSKKQQSWFAFFHLRIHNYFMYDRSVNFHDVFFFIFWYNLAKNGK